jgi:2-aminoethylphosphonate-pyruvate transaminase
LVRNDLWRISEQIPPRSYYLDLKRYRAAFKDSGQTPFTPPVPAILALEQALVELEEQGGPPARRHRYLELNRIIRRSLHGLGIDTLVNGDEAPCSLTTARLPEGRDFDDIQGSLWHEGFVVYEAKGPLNKSHFLIANMGELDERQIESFVETLARVVGRALVPAGAQLLSS